MTPQRFLIFEENPAIIARVQTALEREGLAIEVLAASVTALKHVDAESLVLDLIDLVLPDLDGWLVCLTILRPVCIPTFSCSSPEKEGTHETQASFSSAHA